ncbi:polymorphic toxin-type HINT domain-containing protein [Streptomyces sp. NPDC047829]|uniref:polymorphic toxin-type HINT domain-containing protein n=1 Tax=Streptomyces sp. NPDC047829 TaxID=3154609 RepID=UPI0033D6D8FE
MSRSGMRGFVMTLAAVVITGVLPPAAVVAAETASGVDLPRLKQPPAVPVESVAMGGKKRPDAAKQHAWKPTAVSWPAAGSAEVAPRKGAVLRAGKLPVSIGDAPSALRSKGQLPAKVRISVAGRDKALAAGVDGVLLSASRTDAGAAPSTASVKVDYSSFRGAYGGDWAARLRLVQLPACALTTPGIPKCRTQTGLPTTNDTSAGVLTAPVTLKAGGSQAAPPMVFAATAEAAGPTGNYKASSLTPSGSWSAGGATGSFNWSYPITIPSVPGGMQPTISLGYSSQSVDGQTAATNNQPSWLGDGWAWEPGYIERRYKPCNDDKTDATNTTRVGDLCWYNDNATLSLGGKTTELVYEEGKGWHPESDAGEKVEKLTGAANDDKGTSGIDGAGEHWRITTTDGTQYHFGLNRLPGWSDHGPDTDDPKTKDDPETNSALTVPVFGNHEGEPCYKATFADAWCQQAWRWQLDYVVDVRGNAMAYYWKDEVNNYGRNVSETTGKSTVTPYDRGAYLDHIDYGLRSDAIYTGKAMGQVHFGVGERCLSSCGTFTETYAKNWPDVPFDLYCKADATECKDQYSPSFWSRKRLTSITTKVLTGGIHTDVDSWTLQQGFPASGDGVSTPMWLESITRTGKAGSAVSLPPVTFAGEQKANRVDKLGDGLAPFVRLRLYQITTEAGGTVAVNYSEPDCTATTLPATDDSNTTRCYHVKWAFEGEDAKDDWFNSYVATQIAEGDNLASTPDKVTSYAYLGGAAWTKGTDELIKADDRTYSVFRGYGRVQIRTGSGFDAKTLSETRYFRGIDGQEVKDSADTAATDRRQFAGMAREQATYNGDDTTKLVSATSYTPWRSEPAATRTRTGLPALESRKTGTQKVINRTTVSTGTRTTEKATEFDQYGMVKSVSETGDTAKGGDERCTLTTYARNTSNHLLSMVARTETLAKECTSTTITRPDDVIDDTRAFYDNSAFGAAPTKGLLTKTDRINGKGDGYDTVSSVPSICGAAKNELCYDLYGRATAAGDAYGKVTTSTYTPTTGESPTESLVINPLGHTITTVLDPLRGQPTQVTDANNKVTTTAYDGLGRIRKVWLPTRSAVTYPDSPNYDFTYQVRTDAPTVITTKTLTFDSKYETTYAFADGLLRDIQTQATSPDRTGRLVSETFYDTRGLAWRSSGTYYTEGAAEPLLVTGQELKYPASTDVQYDGAGRTTAVISRKFGDETKRTVTTYTGDATTVVPPKGGIATTTVTDALGRTTELREYTNAGRTTSQATKYTYDHRGLLKQVTDPSSAAWTYGYDVRGRQTSSTDPDKGSALTTYDQGDRVTDTKDARQITLHTDYDVLGRATALKKGTTTLATWTYDTVAKGQLSKATRYIDGAAYESAITSYNSLYQPVLTQVTIPVSEGSLAGTYKWTTSYNPNTGQVMWTKQPAMGGLPSETISNTYTAVSGLLNTVGVPDAQLVSKTTYDHYGRNTRREYGEFAQHLWTTSVYDDHTGQMTRAYTDREVAPQRIEDTKYSYDPAGNVTAIAAAYGQDAARTTDTQCLTLDALTRVTEAWTNTGEQCATAPSTTVVGGQDAYWTSYTYDAVGNRKTETQHRTASGPTADTVRTYAAPTVGKHNLPKVSQTGTNAHEETFTYDDAGNTKTRQIGTAAAQTLQWDEEGHLKSVTQGTAVSQYLYDPDGQRMVRRDSTGTTLYLPGGNELHLNKNGSVTGTRYYTADDTIAVRANGKLTFLVNDHHGTNTTQITADAAQIVTRRKSTLFGAPRGSENHPWVGDKGFVGGTKDTDTGLTHLGAREYDPAIGRFISVDPVMNLASSQQLNGYTYANNNPATLSDPSGLCPKDVCGGFGQNPLDKDPDAFHGDPDDVNNETAGRGGESGTTENTDGTPSVIDLGKGEAPPPPVKLVKKYFGEFKSLQFVKNKIGQWGNVLGFNLSYELILRERCLGGGPNEVCSQLSKYYDGWKHIKKIDTLDTCPICGNIGFDFLLAGRMGAWKGAGKWKGVKFDCFRCFLAGTDVLMADGRTKDIEDVEVGDEVQATDPLTGESGPRRVTQLIVTENDKKFNELSIATENGIEKLTATHEHPFWSPSLNDWVEARDLSKGMTLLTDDGETVIVTANRPFAKHARTYNFTVDDLHTYYVLAGQTPVLVHNSNCDLPEGYTSSPALKGDPYHPDSVAGRSAQNRELYAGTVGDRAGALGYRQRIPAQRAPFNSHGQVVFSNGKNYITPDVDGHNVSGGWKMFNRKGQRIGTYDPDLNYLKE